MAEYPAVVVVGGTAYFGEAVEDAQGGYYKYTTGNGVLLLCNATGGDVYWGSDENAAITAGVAGSWDGWGNITYSNTTGKPTVAIPQLLIYYSLDAKPQNKPTLSGPSAITFLGDATVPASANNTAFYVAAYNGLPSKCIFMVDNNTSCSSPGYLYQAGPTAMTVTNNSGNWSPTTLSAYTFPAQLYVNEKTLALLCFSENASGNVYSCSATYVDGNGSSQADFTLSLTTDPFGMGIAGDITGYAEGMGVNGCGYLLPENWTNWLSWYSQRYIGLVPPETTTPRYGIKKWLVNSGGNCYIRNFLFVDMWGNDVYEGGLSYDGSMISNGWEGMWWNEWSGGFVGFMDNWGPVSTTSFGQRIAAVSSDGMSVSYAGFTLITNGEHPGDIKIPYTYWNLFLYESPMFVLDRPDGSKMFVYWCDGGDYVQAPNGKIYSDSRVIDIRNGWPEADLAKYIEMPYSFYFNGVAYNANYDYYNNCYYNYSGCDFNRWEMCYSPYFSDWNMITASFSANSTSFSLNVGGHYFTSLNGLSTDGLAYLGAGAGNWPSYGPSIIERNGTYACLLFSAEGVDVYSDGTTIDSERKVNNSSTERYNPSTGQFTTPGWYGKHQDLTQVGRPNGLICEFEDNHNGLTGGWYYEQYINYTNPSFWPSLTDGLVAEIKYYLNCLSHKPGGNFILLTSGSATASSYSYIRGYVEYWDYDYASWGEQYSTLAAGSLFRVSDEHGQYTSPVYRYGGAGSNAVVYGHYEENVWWGPNETDEILTDVYYDYPVYPGDWGNFGTVGYNWSSSGSITPFYPPAIYVNNQYAALDSSTEYLNATSGGVKYRIVPNGAVISVDWQWAQGTPFRATVSGTLDGVVGGVAFANQAFSGLWDGHQRFGCFPSALAGRLTISLQPVPASPRTGPPQVAWNGVPWAYSPVDSVVSAANPGGADAYVDANGVVRLTIGRDGAVTLYDAAGVAEGTGVYQPQYNLFTLNGPGGGNGGLVALDEQGKTVGRGGDGTGDFGGEGGGVAGATTELLGNLDIHGNYLTRGSWLRGSETLNGLTLSYRDGPGRVQELNPQTGALEWVERPAEIRFSSTRQAATWVWSHASADGGSGQVSAMELDTRHRLILTGTGSPGVEPPRIVLDPNVGLLFNGNPLLTQAAADALYLAGTAPAPTEQERLGLGAAAEPGSRLTVVGDGATAGITLRSQGGEGWQEGEPWVALQLLTEGGEPQMTLGRYGEMKFAYDSERRVYFGPNELMGEGWRFFGFYLEVDGEEERKPLLVFDAWWRRIGMGGTSEEYHPKALLDIQGKADETQLLIRGYRENEESGGQTANLTEWRAFPENGEVTTVVDSRGRVGICTSSPQAELDVQGSAKISGDLEVGGTIHKVSTEMEVLGKAKISGNLEVEGVIRVEPRGDIEMGPFTARPPSPNP